VDDGTLAGTDGAPQLLAQSLEIERPIVEPAVSRKAQSRRTKLIVSGAIELLGLSRRAFPGAREPACP
jgi:hypothetical protein